MNMDTPDLQDWVGRQEICFANITATQAQAMTASGDVAMATTGIKKWLSGL